MKPFSIEDESYDQHFWIKEFDELRELYGFGELSEGAYSFDCDVSTMVKKLDEIGLHFDASWSDNFAGELVKELQ